MKPFTYISGNKQKIAYLEKYIGVPVEHVCLDLPEIQSLDPCEVASQKAKSAYEILLSPVLVEDTYLILHAFGRLPGPFIKFFEAEMGYDILCQVLDGRDRSATAGSVFAYYDGHDMVLFEGKMGGSIAQKPIESINFGGWDRIFVPDGYSLPRGVLPPEDDEKTYREIKPVDAVRAFLTA